MLDAKEARDIVKNHFVEGEVESKTWCEKYRDIILRAVKVAANKGQTECSCEIFLEKENYELPKKKMLLDMLLALGYKVGVTQRTSKDTVIRTFTVYTVVWS